MPAYVSHSIMALDVYNKLDNKNVSLDYMLTYSLGGDLARFSKCRRECHKVKMEEFIDNMWDYMKDYNLTNDSIYLGVLYGHICHYYMDMICHPLIRKVDKISKCVSVKSHTLIEGYIDSYLVRERYNEDIEKFKTKHIFNGKIRKIYKMINYVYVKTYGVKNVAFSYFLSIFFYSKIRLLFILLGKKILRRFSKFDKYMSINTDLDLVNRTKKIKYDNYLGNECCDSFMELYDKSIEKAICRINNLE